MKQLSIFIGTFIILYITACSNSSIMATRLVQTQHTSEITIINGGNPEVYNKKMNLCFPFKNSAKAQCLEQLYKNVDILVIQNENNRPIVLAGRGKRVEKREIKIDKNKRVIIYLDTTNVKKPLRCSVKSKQVALSDNRTIFDIESKQIEDRLTIQDQDGKLILDYKIVK